MKFKKSLILAALSAFLTSAYVMPTVSFTGNISSVSAVSVYRTVSNSNAKFTFSIEDSEYLVIHSVEPKYKPNKTTTVRVEKFFEGYKVVIAPGAFSNLTAPVYLIFSDHIHKIQTGAFDNCSQISKIKFNAGCDLIENNSFSGCSNLKTLIINNDFASTEIDSYAFNNCSNLSSLEINLDNSLKSEIIVRKKAFNGCTNLDDLKITGYQADHSALYINEGAFESTPLLKNTDVIQQIDHNKKNYYFTSSKTLKGTILNVVVLADKKGIFNYTENDIENYENMFNLNYKSITDQAKKYDKDNDLNFKTKIIHVSPESTQYANENSEINTAINDAFNYYDYYSKAPYFESSINQNLLEPLIHKQIECDSIVYTYVLQKDPKTPSSEKVRSYESNASIYLMDYQDNMINDIFYHELLHAFGATDYYFETGNNLEISRNLSDRPNCLDQKYADTYLYNDIMYGCNVDNRIGWHTAASIGWTDTFLTDDYNSINWINYRTS